MNTAKIAAALHALADAFLEGGDEKPTKTTKGGKKTTEAETVTPAANVTPAAVTPTPVPAPAPAAPTVTLDQLNKAVLKVAGKNRDKAVAILGSFGLVNTVGLATDKWQAVFDAFEEEIAKQDAAAVFVQQASLV